MLRHHCQQAGGVLTFPFLPNLTTLFLNLSLTPPHYALQHKHTHTLHNEGGASDLLSPTTSLVGGTGPSAAVSLGSWLP